MKRDFTQAVEFSHQLFEQHVGKGSLVIDATAGNGYDTAFLAQLVGSNGHVYAFDVQEVAIESTSARLARHTLCDRVTLIHSGHEHMEQYIDEPVDGILFNLGYLPKGEKKVITKVETTLPAIKSGVQLLREGGLVVVVVYAGHPGGEKELQALTEYVKTLNDREYNVLHYRFINQTRLPPQVLAIKKRSR